MVWGTVVQRWRLRIYEMEVCMIMTCCTIAMDWMAGEVSKCWPSIALYGRFLADRQTNRRRTSNGIMELELAGSIVDRLIVAYCLPRL